MSSPTAAAGALLIRRISCTTTTTTRRANRLLPHNPSHQSFASIAAFTNAASSGRLSSRGVGGGGEVGVVGDDSEMRLPQAAAAIALATSSSIFFHSIAPVHCFSSSSRLRMSSASTTPPPTPPPPGQTDDDDGNDGSSGHPLEALSKNFDHSWISQLDPEPASSRTKASRHSRHDESSDSFDRSKRPVYAGHYVEVKPTPLKNPRLVLHSPDMARRLQLGDAAVRSEEFTKFFSGDTEGALESSSASASASASASSSAADDAEDAPGGNSDGKRGATWATPYALSIMGTRYTSNCPFGTGDGYGDGRAISIGEVTVSPDLADGTASPRYELQLKGAGPTPFCRGADGRAVLRSSIREFLASEAMHFLGVPTTRALSLIVSDGPDGDTSNRPWYSEMNKRELPSMDDPRLAQYDDAQKRQILSQLAVQSRDNPDIMIQEPCAITCRVAPSFVRIGHVDLFARRATKGLNKGGAKGGEDGLIMPKYDAASIEPETEALEKMIWHAAYREFPRTAFDPYREEDDIVPAAKALLRGSMEGISSVVADWIRVGFTQGNFNADNCLVGGRTMDYGPFGFVDEYHPLYAKWTGSGEHFGFLNQPQAGFTNFAVLVESVLPVIYGHLGKEEGNKVKEEIMAEGTEMFQRKVNEVFRIKLGFHPKDEAGDDVWEAAEPLLRQGRADWTMFWRQLTEVARQFPVTGEAEPNYGDMLEVLVGNDEVREGSSAFYQNLDADYRAKFLKWIQKWRETLVESYKDGGASAKAMDGDDEAIAPEERMRLANPKYVLREWILVEAYNKAAKGDESMVKELLELVTHPYDEGTDDQVDKYYRRTPDAALKAGGTAYMS